MYLNALDINSAWRRILNRVWYDGWNFRSQRGGTKELYNLLVAVKEPYDKQIDGFPMGIKELEDYAKQLLNPDKKGFEYTYGERIRAWGEGILNEPVDQLEEIICRLKKNRNTRRATAVTWIPPVDDRNSEVPCMIMLDFKVRDRKLCLTTVFRSNDMFGAWPANVFALNKLNHFAASKVKVSAGSITTLSVSAHVYDHDYQNVQKILGLV